MLGRLESVLEEALGKSHLSARDINSIVIMRERRENALCRDGRCQIPVSDASMFAARRVFGTEGRTYECSGTYYMVDPQKRLFSGSLDIARLIASGEYTEEIALTTLSLHPDQRVPDEGTICISDEYATMKGEKRLSVVTSSSGIAPEVERLHNADIFVCRDELVASLRRYLDRIKQS